MLKALLKTNCFLDPHLNSLFMCLVKKSKDFQRKHLSNLLMWSFFGSGCRKTDLNHKLQSKSPNMNGESKALQHILKSFMKLTRKDPYWYGYLNWSNYFLQVCHVWYIDSGCSRHMTEFKHLLHNYIERPGGTVSFGNKSTSFVRGYEMLTNGNITIQKVLYVDGLGHNLFSISKLCDSIFHVRFSITSCSIDDKDGVEIFHAKRFDNLYVVKLDLAQKVISSEFQRHK